MLKLSELLQHRIVLPHLINTGFFTSMLIHGVSPGDLLLSTLVPIPENKRGNKCKFNNDRQIAISSILRKINGVTDDIILQNCFE